MTQRTHIGFGKSWLLLLAALAMAALAGCGGGAGGGISGGSEAAPSGGSGDTIAIEIPMIVPTSLNIGSDIVGASSISSPLTKALMASKSVSSPLTPPLMAALSPNTYLNVNGMTDALVAILDGFVSDALATVFEDNGVPIKLTSNTGKHSATILKSDGSTLYVDYKAFNYTALTTTDPVGINPDLQTCSGNNASPTTTSKAICMRAWLVPQGADPADSTADYRFMEAVFTVKPTELTKGAAAFHTISYFETIPLNAGYTYNKDSDTNKVFANVNGVGPSVENPDQNMYLLGDRFYSAATTDSTGTLRFLNSATFQPERAGLNILYYYETGTHLRESLKDTNIMTDGHSEYSVYDVCVNRTTGVEDLTGASCSALPSTSTASYYGPAAPSDYTFQADFFKQPPSGFDPTN